MHIDESKVLNHAGDTTYKTQSHQKQHNDKNTANVKVNQNTKIDAQRHTTCTDRHKRRMAVPHWNGQRHMSLGV